MADVSEILAIESIRDPSLVPNLSNEETLLIVSDYSRGQGLYKTYSFLVFGQSQLGKFDLLRTSLRTKFSLHNRRISFKGLNDRIKLKALPEFLSLADTLNGFVLSFVVNSSIADMFAQGFLEIWPDLAVIKTHVLEEMLRVAHFGALASLIASNDKQNIIWLTDNDDIVANEKHQQHFGKIAEATMKIMSGIERTGKVAFGLTALDDGGLHIEDLAAIPDLSAGALCEVTDSLRRNGQYVVSKICLRPPPVSKKTNLICRWLANDFSPLKKFGVTFDKTGTDPLAWCPTFFSLKQQRGLLA